MLNDTHNTPNSELNARSKAGSKATEPEPEQKSGISQFISQGKANFKATEGLLIALTYVFTLTFLCFPALADDSYFKFLSGNSEEASWYNLISVLIFNSSDLTGRYIGGSSCADLKRKTVLFMAAFRTIFILTFLLVAFEVSPVWLFQADWFKILNYALFSFTNGYTSTLCAIKAP